MSDVHNPSLVSVVPRGSGPTIVIVQRPDQDDEVHTLEASGLPFSVPWDGTGAVIIGEPRVEPTEAKAPAKPVTKPDA